MVDNSKTLKILSNSYIYKLIEMRKFLKVDGHIFFPCRVTTILIAILVSWGSKIEEILNFEGVP